MDDCIVALERDIGHDPEAFRLAVEMLRRETWGSTDESVPRHEPILLGEPTPSAATHPTTTKSSSLGRSGPQALNRSFATPSRSRSPASIPAASRATAANKASSDRSARVLSALTTAASNIPSTSRHYAPTIDVTQLLVPPNALQTSVVQMFVTGRSMIALCGRRSGRAVLTTMLAQLASQRLDGFSFTSARTAIVCGESCFDRLVAGPLGFMSRNGEVLLDSAARLESNPWTVEDLAGVGVLIVMGNVPELSPNVLDGVLARLQTTPQTVVLIDAYSPELFTRDNELADAVTWAVGHPSGAADVPLHVVRLHNRIRSVYHESGGRANIALRVRKEEDKLAALKRLMQEMFDSYSTVVVCQSFRKAERLAEALNHFTPGVLSLAAIHRDPLDFSDAMKALIDNVHARESLRATDEWRWTPRLIVVTDAPSLRKISYLDRLCAVVFFDVPPPATTTNACPVLHCKTTLFPDVPLTAVITAGPTEAKAVSGAGWIDVHPLH